MKKALLLSALIIPMVIGCNKNKTPGLVDPFKDVDKYEKTGRTLAASETIDRALTTKEEADLAKTTIAEGEEGKKIYTCDQTITKDTVEIHERSYLRAFAGEFKQGYSISNYLNEETRTILYGVNTKAKTDPNIEHRRYIGSSASTISDYSYGRIQKDIVSEELCYYATKNDLDSGALNSASDCINDRIRRKGEDPVDSIFPDVKEKGKESASWDPYISYNRFNIKQSEFISKPGTSVTTGVNKNDESDKKITVIGETQEGYVQKEGAQTGIIELKDGRKYRANQNTLRVAKLKLVKKDSNEYYLVTSARKYNEVVVISKEIQPNQQIEMLSEPIVVYYCEEFHEFSNSTNYTEEEQNSLNTIPQKEEK